MPRKGQMQPTFRMSLNKSQEKTGNALSWTQWTYDCIQFTKNLMIWMSEESHKQNNTGPMMSNGQEQFILLWLALAYSGTDFKRDCSAVQVQSIAWGSKIRDFTKIQSIFQVQKSHPLYSDFQSSGWFHVKKYKFWLISLFTVLIRPVYAIR